MPPQQRQVFSDDEHETTGETSVAFSEKMKGHDKQAKPFLSPVHSLPLLVLNDMFAVALVVPLLFQYYQTAGVTNASQRELLSSLFSSSQIIGGLLLGFIADSGLIQRRTILYISFIGSALSYALIVQGGFWALICSRIIVGLVKQTMTVTTTLMARYTTTEDRTKHMARLTASSTVAWVVGPSIGGFLYKNVDERAPAIVACGIFLLNILLTALLIPKDDDDVVNEQPVSDKKSSHKKFSSFTSNLRSCFESKALGSTILSLLLFSWVARATSYASMASYYEEMYGIQPHQRGYLSSYQQFLNFVVQSGLIAPLLQICGGERKASVLAAFVLAIATWLEINASLSVFVVVLCPAISASVALMRISLRSIVTHVAPKESLGSVLAALDVLQNVAAVTVPFYRTVLFSLMVDDGDAVMKGDPNPKSWLLSSGLHWFVAALLMGYFLIISKHDDSPKVDEKKKNT